MTINDAKDAALTALGFSSELEYLHSLGATSNALNDAWLQVAGLGSFNDQVMAYMVTDGAIGDDFNAVKLDYWINLIPPEITTALWLTTSLACPVSKDFPLLCFRAHEHR